MLELPLLLFYNNSSCAVGVHHEIFLYFTLFPLYQYLLRCVPVGHVIMYYVNTVYKSKNNFVCSSVWVGNLVSDIKGGILAEDDEGYHN
jgi:hypothetical protein